VAARLKVFTWSDGFHAFTVAVGSRPKAVEAWGSRQDLFATGLASELSGGPDYEAALASPGEVIQRGLAIDIGKIGKAPKPKKGDDRSKARKAKIDRLEAELAALDEEQVQALTGLDDEAARLDARRAALVDDHDKSRRTLVAKLKAARKA